MVNESIKEKIYKYYSFNSDINKMFLPVTNNILKFTPFDSFNDPYDCYIYARLNGSFQSVPHHMIIF